jgi:hypothetical protein
VEPSSRIAEARRRVRLARYVLGAAAVAGFAVFGAAARGAHPATHQAASTAESSDSQTASSSFGFGTASLGDSGNAAPQIQSGGS